MDTQKNPPPYEPVAPNAVPPPSAFQYNAAPPPPPPTYGFTAPTTNFSAGHKFRVFFLLCVNSEFSYLLRCAALAQ